MEVEVSTRKVGESSPIFEPLSMEEK
jgi:hypothetical protein